MTNVLPDPNGFLSGKEVFVYWKTGGRKTLRRLATRPRMAIPPLQTGTYKIGCLAIQFMVFLRLYKL